MDKHTCSKIEERGLDAAEMASTLDQLIIQINASHLHQNYSELINELLTLLDQIAINEEAMILNTCTQLHRLLTYIEPKSKTIKKYSCSIEFGSISILTAKLHCPSSKIQILTLKCLKIILKMFINEQADQFKRCQHACILFEVIVDFLKTNQIKLQQSKDVSSESEEMIHWNKIVLNTLRVIYCLIIGETCEPSLLTVKCGDSLGLLKFYIFYGLPGYNISKFPISSLYPSPLSQFVPLNSEGSPKKTPLKKRNTKKKGKTVNAVITEDEDETIFSVHLSCSSDTDSEYASSDQEGKCVDIVQTVRNYNTKIRLISFNIIESLVKQIDKRTLFGYWSSFIPDSSGPLANQFTVITTMLKDPSPKVRIAALNVVRELLSSGSSFVLSLAEDKQTNPKISFTPLSVTLAHMIGEIHKGFYLTLFAENKTEVLLHALKCMSVLISVTPYNKLQPGLLTNVLNKSLYLIEHNEVQMQNSCLAFYVSAFSLDPLPNELLVWTKSEDGQKCLNKLVRFAILNIQTIKFLNLSGESLKFITTFLRLNIDCSYMDFPELARLSIDFACNDIVVTDLVIQSLICKLFIEVASSFKKPDIKQRIFKDDILKWWISFINSILMQKTLQPGSKEIQISSQSSLLDVIASVDSSIFDEFPNSLKYHMLTAVLSKCQVNDTENLCPISVRASSVRSLGVFAAFPMLSNDVQFLTDAAFILKDTICQIPLKPSKDEVWLFYQTSWAFGNITDVFKKVHSSNIELGGPFFFEMASVSSKAFAIHVSGIQGDNIRTNLIRALSNLIQLLLIRKSHTDLTSFLSDAVDHFTSSLKNYKSYKLHWNICHAFSDLFAVNEFIESIPIECLDSVVSLLLDVLATTKNYKVQSYVVEALCSLKFDLPSKPLHEIYCIITEFFIDNYHSVTIELQKNWTLKFSAGLNQLYGRLNAKNQVNVEETLTKLKSFLENNVPQYDEIVT